MNHVEMAIGRWLLRSFRRNRPVVLMYHGIAAPGTSTNWKWDLEYSTFHDHLSLLKQASIRVVSIEQLLDIDPVEWPRIVCMTFDDGLSNCLMAAELLSSLDMRATFFVPGRGFGEKPQWEDAGRPPCVLLSISELRRLSDMGMEIGSHSLTHTRLTFLPEQDLCAEVFRSRVELENILEKKVTSFAYPYGDYDARVIEAVKRAGYRAACTTDSGSANPISAPWSINRLAIYRMDSASVLARKLAFVSNDSSWRQIWTFASRRFASRILGRTQ